MFTLIVGSITGWYKDDKLSLKVILIFDVVFTSIIVSNAIS